MDSSVIFVTQLVMSVGVYSLLAKWVVLPWLKNKDLTVALMILIAPHATRHIGLTFLVPSVTDPAIPASFAFMAAWGDFASAVFAVVCLIALKASWRWALLLVWLFSIFGTVDLLIALSQVEVVSMLAGTWYIPTFLVPLLLVTHYLIFARLLAEHVFFKGVAITSVSGSWWLGE